MKITRTSVSTPGRLIDYITPPVLGVVPYRRLWVAGSLYYQAHWMEIIVTGWVVLTLTGSASSVGLVAFFRTLPMLVLGLIFGTLIDRFSRTGVLFAIQLTGLSCVALLGMIFYLGQERFWLICVLAWLIGCAWAADFAARRALISELNTRETTANAMSLEALSMQGGKIIAPVAGGVLLGFGGAWVAYLGVTLVFTAGLAALMRFRAVYVAPERSARPSVSVLNLIRSGWSDAIQIPIVKVALVVTVLMNLLVFPYQQLISVVAGEILAVGPGRMGVLAAAAGVGSALMASFLTFRGRPETARRFYVGGATLGAMLLIALALSSNFNLSVTLQLFLGASFGAFGAMQPVLIVHAVEPELRARAMGLLAMAIGTTPVGILLTGTLSSLIGPAVTIGGLAVIASCLLLIILVRNREMLLASG